MGNSIHYQLRPAKRRILRDGDEMGIVAQEGVFLDLGVNEGDGLLCHLHNAPFEGNIFHYIHFATKALFIAQIADNADASPLEELLWVFAKK